MYWSLDPGYISTLLIVLVATLTLSTCFPFNVATLAIAPIPFVLLLLNLILSPTLYPSPPVSIPIFSTFPGVTAKTSTFWLRLLGVVTYGYETAPSIKL